jgi:hypothetical protein
MKDFALAAIGSVLLASRTIWKWFKRRRSRKR